MRFSLRHFRWDYLQKRIVTQIYRVPGQHLNDYSQVKELCAAVGALSSRHERISSMRFVGDIIV